MKLCTETLTIFNARVDPDTGDLIWYPTTIKGCSWHAETVSAIETSGELKAANKTIVRIPTNAAAEKEYVDPRVYACADPETYFTIRTGDLIVRGIETIVGLTKASLMERRETAVILGVTDNRRAHAPHWKVTAS